MKKRLGDILLARGVVDALQLQSALAYQRKWGVALGQVVVDQRFCTAEAVLSALATQSGVEAVDLDAQPLDASLARLIPCKVAEAHRVVPLRLEGQGAREVLVVALAAPASLATLDVVKSVSGKARVVPRLATDAALGRAIGRLYRGEPATPRRRPGMESFSLPEWDESMPLVVGSSLAELTDMPAPEPVRRADSPELPMLAPLEPAWVPTPKPRVTVREQVLVYGWGADAAAGLVRVLSGAGFTVKVASTGDVCAATEAQVVVAPLPAMEVLAQRLRAQVLVAGKAPERDLPRAQAVHARGFVAAPVDPDLLLRSVRRLSRASEEARLKHAS
ncbi:MULTISPECIES: general secretion pathway protein GspE [unclassified Corallococcus]|uniref:GspE/PulE/PilB domain-containing protein n=1 Tax=unclassified Corallococcus TaxID=2685029 RepID=UPI001A8F7039|nr:MULTISPECIES: general secretion pathway protein GspE [unclassified Corallococcus]MBN9681424.1 general secretion pathway protein GspE [Corallococcus sp. NCSPR001]WAS86998.1 general secretion pathway protein GspE [Corallococcus sp. NCRR]